MAPPQSSDPERFWFEEDRPTSEGPEELPVIPELRDDYEILRKLGQGGTAVVYLAREKELGRLFAIKLMHPSHAQDEEAMARMVREAKTISRLQHPNIVMLYGARRLADRGYALILQYVPGVTVKQRLRESGPFPLPLVERVLIDLGTALQYAHHHRIVHRDIKPENIFIDEDTGAARLADFGIARFWDSDSGLTLPGTTMGTPNYMSPEQVDGSRDLDGRSDIYSVGLVAWEMATGRQPWAGETLYNVVYKQKHEQLPSLEELRPDMPHYFRVAIEGALKKNPAERWRDAGELLAALQNPYANLARSVRDRTLTIPSHPAPEVPGAEPPLRPPQGAGALGLEDMDTIVVTREEIERSWARAWRDGDPSSAAGKGPGGTRRRTEPRPSATSPSTSPPGREAPANPDPPAGSNAEPPQRPAEARGKSPAAPPPDPAKPLPSWLVQLEQGKVYHGPWMIDTEPPPRSPSRGLVTGIVLILLAATIAGVLVLF